MRFLKKKKTIEEERAELEGKNAREILNIIHNEDNEEFSITFKMPKQIFKNMLPIMQQTRQLPIMFQEQELRKITEDFMIKQKNKIILGYGIK